MAKFYGAIGFTHTVEDPDNPGVWYDDVVTRRYYGDITADYRKRQNGTGTNDDINLSNMVSIVADPEALNSCSNIVYAEINGTKWKVTNVEVRFPRLILSVGGVYNEQEN